MSDPSPTPRPDGETRPTDRDRIEAALLAHFHGPGYNAVGHGTPGDCAPCREAAEVVRAAVASLTEDLATARQERDEAIAGERAAWKQSDENASEQVLAEERYADASGQLKAARKSIESLRSRMLGAEAELKSAIVDHAASRRVVEAARELPTDYAEGLIADHIHDLQRGGDAARSAHWQGILLEFKDFDRVVESLPAQREETWMCGAFQRASYRAGYRCTEPSGHAGPHRAVLDGAVLAEWTGPNGEETSNG